MEELLVSDMYLLFNADRLVINPYFGPMKMAHGFTGSILMDLVLYERIEVIGNKIKVINTSPIGESFLDGALNLIAKAKPSKKINYYLNYLLKNGEYLYKRISEQLTKLNYMKTSISKKGFIPNITVEFVNSEIREKIVDTVSEILLNNKSILDKNFWYFLSLLRATRSFNDIFGKENKKQIKVRLKELIGDEPIGKQVRKAIREAETADAGVS